MAEQGLPTGIESIIVVGPTGAGVTTLINTIREYRQRNPSLANEVVIPHRYTTRPLRPDDNVDEISSLGRDVFDAGVRGGAIEPHWTRRLDIHHEERYGFDQKKMTTG